MIEESRKNTSKKRGGYYVLHLLYCLKQEFFYRACQHVLYHSYYKQ